MLSSIQELNQQVSTYSRVQLVSQADTYYKTLRKIVSEKYAMQYKARVWPKPDLFVALDSIEKEDLSGACYGVTLAKNGKLLSESYLDQSVELSIKSILGIEVRREEIAECGNFVSFNMPGSGCTLIETLPWLCWSLGLSYVLFTGTSQVIKIMQRNEIPFYPLELNPASKVDENFRLQWGSYYQQNLITGIMDLAKGCEQILHNKSRRYQLYDCKFLVKSDRSDHQQDLNARIFSSSSAIDRRV